MRTVKNRLDSIRFMLLTPLLLSCMPMTGLLGQADSTSGTYIDVDVMPAIGNCKMLSGDERHQCTQLEIVKYVASNTLYPPEAKAKGIQGTVFVYFVVDEEGVVVDVRTLKPVDPLCDAEAMRVVKTLPRFEPGIQDGKRVRTQYCIPVKFIIRGNSSDFYYPEKKKRWQFWRRD